MKPPLIKSINPILIPLIGTQITITGDNFSNQIKVMIGDQRVKFTAVSSSQLLVDVPPGPAGSRDVKIIGSDGSWALEEQVLLYLTLYKGSLPTQILT